VYWRCFCHYCAVFLFVCFVILNRKSINSIIIHAWIYLSEFWVMQISHFKKCWVVLTHLWVKYKLSHWVKCLNNIFNPTFGFVHIRPKFGLKQPSIFLECRVWDISETSLNEDVKNRDVDPLVHLYLLEEELWSTQWEVGNLCNCVQSMVCVQAPAHQKSNMNAQWGGVGLASPAAICYQYH